MSNYILKGCPVCGGNKGHATHKYATYRAYEYDTNFKLVCKTCKFTFYLRTIRGGQRQPSTMESEENENEDD